ncbi:MAG: SLATT domain-containing protein [Euryarchaeota archaeon]|nr:SLATT domain-containing protein [Euryarchaeota archaeon]
MNGFERRNRNSRRCCWFYNGESQVITLTKEGIIKEAKRIEENSLYSAKGHFVAAQFWTNFHLWIGVPAVILAALAGTSALAQFDNHNIIAGILSIIVVVLTSITTFLNPKEKAHIHLSSGNNYDSLLSRSRIFWSIDCRRENPEELLADKLRDLSEQRDRLNRECPQVPRGAYKKAKKGIEEGEANYKVDENAEI